MSNCPKCKRCIKITDNYRMKLEKFKCSLCDFRTFDSIEIRNHISTEHSRSTVVFQCNICLITTATEEKLKKHNTEEHSFTCAICSKKFLRKKALEMHMEKHNGEKRKDSAIDETIEIN